MRGKLGLIGFVFLLSHGEGIPVKSFIYKGVWRLAGWKNWVCFAKDRSQETGFRSQEKNGTQEKDRGQSTEHLGA
jgi:hypothetical protein